MVKQTQWIAPVFIVIGIFAIWLSITYLPLDSLGITIPSDNLWNYLPWLIIFAVGLYVLKEVYFKK